MKPQSSAADDTTRVIALVGIFIISFCAAGFPTAARRLPFIRVPSLLFFIGKHFGTGVILSTAFVHLLSDAFLNLQGLKALGLKNWPGLIVLGSLLSIFLVEYISTVYVETIAENRQAHPDHHEAPNGTSHHDTYGSVESSPALVASPKSDRCTLPGDGRGRCRHHSHHEHHHGASEHSALVVRRNSQRDAYFDVFMHHHDHSHATGHCEEEETDQTKDKVVQLLGVLVLQLGIMLHSFVIGMTLAVTPPSHLVSLLTAIIFHQLFEGLSLGVRLSSLPSTIQASPSSPPRSIRYVPSLLTFLFGITTPLGIVVGLLIEHFIQSDAVVLDPPVLLASASKNVGGAVFRGSMSAVSAGLLIYASCVELLAGDFVMDGSMRRSSRGRQTLAIVSLMAGTVSMSLIK